MAINTISFSNGYLLDLFPFQLWFGIVLFYFIRIRSLVVNEFRAIFVHSMRVE